MRVDLLQYPQGSDTPDTSCCPTENGVALNPAIVKTMQWDRLGLFISTRNIGYGDHEPYLQNGVVRHHVETSGVDGRPRIHLPVNRPILSAGRYDKCDPFCGVEEGKAQSNDRPQYLPTH